MTPPFTFRVHPPERGPVLPQGLMCGCSSCCCCCLHSIGGIAGSVIAARRSHLGPGLLADQQPTSAAGLGPAISDIGQHYWLTVLGLSLLCACFGWIGIGAAVLLLPAIQLVAALGVLIAHRMGPQRPSPEALQYLGRVTIGCVAGTVLGIMVMGMCVGLLK